MPTLKVWDGSQFHEIKGDKGAPGEVTNAALESRVAPIEGSVSALDARVADTEVDTSRLNTQRYDVRAFGAAGSGDSVVAAMEAAHLAGGGIITGPKDTYTFTQPVRHYHNVTVDMPLGTVFDMTGVTTGIEGAVWYGEGELTALPALASNVAQGAMSITLASAPSVQPGDWLNIYNSTDRSFSHQKASYRNGEFARVVGVSGNTITLDRATYAGYATGGATTVYRMEPLVARIAGVHFELPNGKWGVRFDLATQVQLDGVTFSGGNWSAIFLRRCVDITLTNTRAFSVDATDGAGVNYGLCLTSVQDVTITNPHLVYGRHGFTTGGSPDVGCVPNRNITIDGGTIGCTIPNNYGADLHGNTEYVTFRNVVMPNGLQIAGDHITYDGCKVWSANNGLLIHAREMLGADHHFTNCDLYPTRSHPADAAFAYIRFVGTGFTRQHGTFQFNDSRIHAKGYRAASGVTVGVMVSTYTGTDFVANNSVEVKNNVVDSSLNGDGDPFYSFWVSGDTGTQGFRYVTITDNDCGLGGPAVIGCSPELTDVSRNNCNRSPFKAANVALASGVGYANPTIVCDGGSSIHAYSSGFQFFGREADTTIIAKNLTALNCGRGGGTGSANEAGVYLRYAKVAIMQGCTLGDTQDTPTQDYSSGIANVTELHDLDNQEIGTPGGRVRSAVATCHYQGRGTAAPEGNIFASPGSIYRSTSTGLVYRKATGTGTTGWVALADVP